ncbi:MAG: RES domain-containing protein [Luteitalea sp.]|nr:RES domain-containing protein [Luteitalea sp.]
MRVFRLGSGRHKLFDGTGAGMRGGRWNSKGRPVIYAASSLSLAMLEYLARAGISEFAPDAVCITIDILDGIRVERVDVTDVPGWNATDSAASREVGDRWFDAQRSAVLLVPSVIVSLEHNVIINPAHPEARGIRAGAPKPVGWDARLRQLAERRSTKRFPSRGRKRSP